jgi:hypothetical protein
MPSATAAFSISEEIGPSIQAVLIRADARPRRVEVAARHQQRAHVAIVNVHHVAVLRVGHDVVSPVPRLLGRLMPVADVESVGSDDARRAPREQLREAARRSGRTAGVLLGVAHAESAQGLVGPRVRVLPLVVETERHDRRVVALELPQDVAGARSAADGKDQRFVDRDAVVRQDVGDVGRFRVLSAMQCVPVVGDWPGLARDVPSSRHVVLACPGHTRADALLELLLRGHA